MPIIRKLVVFRHLHSYIFEIYLFILFTWSSINGALFTYGCIEYPKISKSSWYIVYRSFSCFGLRNEKYCIVLSSFMSLNLVSFFQAFGVGENRLPPEGWTCNFSFSVGKDEVKLFKWAIYFKSSSRVSTRPIIL